MSAYSRLQEKEFSCEQAHGYEATKHQHFVGTGYFDEVQQVIAGGTASTTALKGSTEAAQFTESEPVPQNGHGLDADCPPILDECSAGAPVTGPNAAPRPVTPIAPYARR
jgi:hypothetical protein